MAHCIPSSVHPQQAHLQLPDLQQMPPCADITPETVAAALRSFPPARRQAHRPPGPASSDVSSPGDTDCFIHALTRVVLLLARGHAPASVAVGSAGGSLVAVPKPAAALGRSPLGRSFAALSGSASSARSERSAHFPLASSSWGLRAGRGRNCGAHCPCVGLQTAIVPVKFHNVFHTKPRRRAAPIR